MVRGGDYHYQLRPNMANFLKIVGILLLTTLPGRGEAAATGDIPVMREHCLQCLDYVVVTGTASITNSPYWDIKTDYNGVYTRYDGFYDKCIGKRPVYIKYTPNPSPGSNYNVLTSGKRNFWLYYSDQQRKWIIDGERFLTSIGYLSSEGVNNCPYYGNNWKTFGGCTDVAVIGQETNTFQDVPTLPVTASSKECLDEVKVTGTANVGTDYTGVYKIDSTEDGKPVYKHNSANLYLYYEKEQAKWKIDTDPNDSDTIGFVFSEGDAPCPYDGTNWKNYHGCIDDISVTKSECVNGIGTDYRGKSSMANCVDWDSELLTFFLQKVDFTKTGLGNHNYCRNPTDDPKGPYCITEFHGPVSCSIPQCKET